MRLTTRRTAAVVLGATLLSTPAVGHGGTAASTGLPVPLVVAGVVAGLVGGRVVLAAYGRLPSSTRAAGPLLVGTLGLAALSSDQQSTEDRKTGRSVSLLPFWPSVVGCSFGSVDSTTATIDDTRSILFREEWSRRD